MMTAVDTTIKDSKEGLAEQKKSKSASFFTRAKLSFARTGGARGANVESLRGTSGSDFEARGYICRGQPEISCCCCFNNSDWKKERFFLVKGPFCFVFVDEDAPAPKFAIGLQNMKPHPHHSHPATVNLETFLGDIEYEICFVNEQDAKQFCSVVKKAAASANAEEVRKKLGHEHLIAKRSSIRFAEQIAHSKACEPPDAPVSTNEIITSLPAELPI